MASVGGMRLRLGELQEEDEKAKDIRANKKEGLKEGWEDPDGVLHHQGMSYVPEIIRTELISSHQNDPHDCQRPRLGFHPEVLVIFVLFFRQANKSTA